MFRFLCPVDGLLLAVSLLALLAMNAFFLPHQVRALSRVSSAGKGGRHHCMELAIGC